MNKEEILERSRNNNLDEGKEFAIKRGEIYSNRIGQAFIIGLSFFNWFNGRESFDCIAIIFAMSIGENFSKYKFNEKKRYIFFIIWDVIMVIISLLAHIKYILG